MCVLFTTLLGTGKIPLSKKAAAAAANAAKVAAAALLTATTDSENKEDSSNSDQVSNKEYTRNIYSDNVTTYTTHF